MNNLTIYILCGRARTGKNTVANMLTNYYNESCVNLSYTTYLKEYAKLISDWDGSEDTKPRELLQTLGTEIIKNKIDNKLLINRTIEDIKVLSYFKKVIIISGARRKEEIDDIKKVYPNVIAIKLYKDKISNSLTEKQNNHITETDLDDYNKFDYSIKNDGSIEMLQEQVNNIIKEVNMTNKVVAIDGPAGSGKGTITKIVANRCNLINIDTGATYRCVALATINNNLKLEDTDKIIELAKKISIEFDKLGNIFLDGIDVTNDIRSKEVTSIVSQISSIVKVREIMVELQRKMAEGHDVIMEGRDITTVVFPNAKYKFYLDATLEERVKRRFIQNKEKKIDMSYEEVLENIKKRDYNDMHKEVGSLTIVSDAIYIDSTNMTIDEVANKIIKIVGSE